MDLMQYYHTFSEEGIYIAGETEHILSFDLIEEDGDIAAVGLGSRFDRLGTHDYSFYVQRMGLRLVLGWQQ